MVKIFLATFLLGLSAQAYVQSPHLVSGKYNNENQTVDLHVVHEETCQDTGYKYVPKYRNCTDFMERYCQYDLVVELEGGCGQQTFQKISIPLSKFGLSSKDVGLDIVVLGSPNSKGQKSQIKVKITK